MEYVRSTVQLGQIPTLLQIRVMDRHLPSCAFRSMIVRDQPG